MPSHEAPVLFFTGASDGVGTTTVALHVAQRLALHESARRVLLIDANPHSANSLGDFLSDVTPRSVSDVLAHRATLYGEALIGYVGAPSCPLLFVTAAEHSTADMTQFVQHVAPQCAAIVIDAGARSTEAAARWWPHVSHWHVVTSRRPVELRRALQVVVQWRRALISDAQLCWITNRCGEGQGDIPRSISQSLGHVARLQLPHDETLTSSRRAPGKFQATLDAWCAQRAWQDRGSVAHPERVFPVATAPEVQMSASSFPTASADTRAVRDQLLEEYLAHVQRVHTPDAAATREGAEQILLTLLAQTDPHLLRDVDRAWLLTDLLQDAVGLGPLEYLLTDPDISEIMVNGTRPIFFERAGRIITTDLHFRSEAWLRRAIDRMVAAGGRRVDESSPIVDTRLADGSRVNIVLRPLAVDGPLVTIRRFGTRAWTLDALCAQGSCSSACAQWLAAQVAARKNILVIGGTGSGKTTLLNALSACIAPDERIITIEDAAELRLQQPHVVRLETRTANLEGEGAVSIRDLVRTALRMRPDRIIVGECRGAEALDMLQAMNTGHDGSLTTLHANNPTEAVHRLATLVCFAGLDLPLPVIHAQIAAAIDLVVQVQRTSTGQREIGAIGEIFFRDERVQVRACDVALGGAA